MSGFFKRLLAHIRRPAPALRAAVLNTGELILVDGNGHSQIFTPGSTDLIKQVLATRSDDAS